MPDAEEPAGGESIDIMERFARNHITMNCQIVSCPGVNDGPALDRTLRDLAEMYPSVNSVSVVPVGVTSSGRAVPPAPVHPGGGRCPHPSGWRTSPRRTGRAPGPGWSGAPTSSICWRGGSCPRRNISRNLTQLDNGVGMLTLLSREFARGLDLMEPEEMEGAAPLPSPPGCPPPLSGAGGPARREVRSRPGTCIPSKTTFRPHHHRGRAGHRRRPDRPARGRDLGRRLLIPANMLRAGSGSLDDVSLDDGAGAGVPVIPVAQDGFELLDAMCAVWRSRLRSRSSCGRETEYFSTADRRGGPPPPPPLKYRGGNAMETISCHRGLLAQCGQVHALQ